MTKKNSTNYSINFLISRQLCPKEYFNLKKCLKFRIFSEFLIFKSKFFCHFLGFQVSTRCLIVTPLLKPYGESEKKALFSNFLFFSTFARRTKKITFFFVKNWTKKCTKNCSFHFLELKSHFPNLRFLHHVLNRENEKKYIKNCKILVFF